MDKMEQWKAVPDYEGLYECSNLGNVRGLDRLVSAKNGSKRLQKGQPLKPQVFNRGQHLRVFLKRDGVSKQFQVHSLVLLTFIGKRPEGYDTCHNNGNGHDNRLSNLRYDTKSNNSLDRVKHGNHHFANKTHCPRDHKLESPNLMPSQLKKGQRCCHICNLIAGYTNMRHRRIGQIFTEDDIDQLDLYYSEKVWRGDYNAH